MPSYLSRPKRRNNEDIGFGHSISRGVFCIAVLEGAAVNPRSDCMSRFRGATVKWNVIGLASGQDAAKWIEQKSEAWLRGRKGARSRAW
jgi:hypothetical protein